MSVLPLSICTSLPRTGVFCKWCKLHQFCKDIMNDNEMFILHVYVAYDALLRTFTYRTEIYYHVQTFLRVNCWATLTHISASVITCINACNNSWLRKLFLFCFLQQGYNFRKVWGRKKKTALPDIFFHIRTMHLDVNEVIYSPNECTNEMS